MERVVREKRHQVVEFIEVALVELRGAAQPRDLAELRELAMDAREAQTPDQLEHILQHAQSLRAFCEQRKESAGDANAISQPPPAGRRST